MRRQVKRVVERQSKSMQRAQLHRPPRRVSPPTISKTAAEFLRLYKTLRDPFVVVDMPGRIRGFNAAFRTMLGYSAAELYGLTYKMFTPPRWHAFETDIVRRQILPLGHSAVYEKEFRRKNGDVFPVELRTFLIRDAQGRPLEMWAVIRDITSRKRVENALRMAQFALEQLSLATFWVARDASILYANRAACQSLGYSREELLALKITDIDPTFRHRSWARHWNVKRGQSRVIETLHQAKNGRVFPVEIDISVFTVDGEQYHCDCVRDITDRKQVEAERQKAHRLLDETVRDRTAELHTTIIELRKAVAHCKRIERTLRQHQHQLRGLVAKLAVAESRERQRIASGIHDDISQMLAAAKMKTGELGELVTSAGPASRLVADLEGMLSQVLDTSRSLTFDLASPVLYRIGLAAALEDLCERMRRSSHVEFTFSTGRQVDPVETAVQELVYQSVKELICNVVHHASAKHASVRLVCLDGVLRVTVSDDGIGFSDASLKGFRPSGGFGLHTIREHIRHLGGRLSIRSLSPQGSSVTLAIPLSHQRTDPL